MKPLIAILVLSLKFATAQIDENIDWEQQDIAELENGIPAPANINDPKTRIEWLQNNWLNPQQFRALDSCIQRTGPILSPNHLLWIHSFDEHWLNRFEDRIQWSYSQTVIGHGEIWMRLKHKYSTQQTHQFHFFRHQQGNVTLRWLLESDPGEPWADHQAFNLHLQKQKQQWIIGDYRISFGLGLVKKHGFRPIFSRSIAQNLQTDLQVSPHSGTQEILFGRGIALTQQWRNTTILGFLNLRKLNGYWSTHKPKILSHSNLVSDLDRSRKAGLAHQSFGMAVKQNHDLGAVSALIQWSAFQHNMNQLTSFSFSFHQTWRWRQHLLQWENSFQPSLHQMAMLYTFNHSSKVSSQHYFQSRRGKGNLSWEAQPIFSIPSENLWASFHLVNIKNANADWQLGLNTKTDSYFASYQTKGIKARIRYRSENPVLVGIQKDWVNERETGLRIHFQATIHKQPNLLIYIQEHGQAFGLKVKQRLTASLMNSAPTPFFALEPEVLYAMSLGRYGNTGLLHHLVLHFQASPQWDLWLRMEQQWNYREDIKMEWSLQVRHRWQ